MKALKPLTHKELVDILGEAIMDSGFREKLMQSPTRTLKDRGFEPNDGVLDFLKSLSRGGFDHAARQIRVKGKHDPIERAGDC